jgi:predicted nucleic acid-binding protein
VAQTSLPQRRAVVSASLDNCDGSAGVLFDTNVWVDCIDAASPWHNWAVEQPDLFIGAHAAVANLSVLTRDPAGYSTYFPRRSLLGP